MSKKWNAHNSVLFALAGLPSTHASLPFNIHFITTSNVVSPTELFAGVVTELRSGFISCIWLTLILSNRRLRTGGFTAYDCVLQEEALYIVWAYACQGDNPMQSELSSHIGLKGNYFCRICYVHRVETAQKKDQNAVIQAAVDFMQVMCLFASLYCLNLYFTRKVQFVQRGTRLSNLSLSLAQHLMVTYRN